MSTPLHNNSRLSASKKPATSKQNQWEVGTTVDAEAVDVENAEATTDAEMSVTATVTVRLHTHKKQTASTEHKNVNPVCVQTCSLMVAFKCLKLMPHFNGIKVMAGFSLSPI